MHFDKFQTFTEISKTESFRFRELTYFGGSFVEINFPVLMLISLLSHSTVPVRIIFLRDPEPQHHWCFPFAVDGNPEPTIKWLINGKALKENRYTYTQLIPDTTDGSQKHGCLFLNQPTHINNGRYTLIVENRLGRDEATVYGMFMDNPFEPHDPEGIIPGEVFFRMK